MIIILLFRYIKSSSHNGILRTIAPVDPSLKQAEEKIRQLEDIVIKLQGGDLCNTVSSAHTATSQATAWKKKYDSIKTAKDKEVNKLIQEKESLAKENNALRARLNQLGLNTVM